MTNKKNHKAMKATLLLAVLLVGAVAALYRVPTASAFEAEVIPGDPIPAEETVPETTAPETTPSEEPTQPQPTQPVQPTKPEEPEEETTEPTVPETEPSQPEETIPEETEEPTVPEETEHTHALVVTDVAATCTTDGYHHVECYDCGEVIEHTIVSAHGHPGYTVTARVEPQVGVDGYVTYTCVNGDHSYTEILPALPVPATEPEETIPETTEPAPEEERDSIGGSWDMDF